MIINNYRNLVWQNALRTLTVTECRVRGIVTVRMEACATEFGSLLAGDASLRPVLAIKVALSYYDWIPSLNATMSI